MKEESFDVLLDVLKVMDQENAVHANITRGISDIVQKFEDKLGPDQKAVMAVEVSNFAKKKRNVEEAKIFRSRLDEMKYREDVESFLNESIKEF